MDFVTEYFGGITITFRYLPRHYPWHRSAAV